MNFGQFQAKREVLKKKPISLAQMKQLLYVMVELSGGICEIIDDTTVDLSERYRIIRQYGDDDFTSQIPDEHWRSAETLRRRWNAVVKRSIDMADSIAPMKAQFAIGVRDVVSDFKRRVMKFVDE